MTVDDLRAEAMQFVATLIGIDGTTSANVHARHDYRPDDILFEHVFVDVLDVLPDGAVKVDYRRFHDTRPVVG
jgi:inward rectifier potassium channel